MATKYKTNKRKLSSLVKQQVPQFVLEDHPKFTEFLSSYYLFMESAELNLTDITAVDNILLETEGTTNSYLLLNQTDKNGLDANGQILDETNSITSSFAKGEVITGSTSGATSTVLAEDITSNSRLFVSANNAWITGETVTGSTSGATAKVGKYRANPVENLQQLLNYSDPDHTINDFLVQMKEEFLNTIPKDTHDSVDTRKLVKNIKSLYRAKGTAKANKAFFRLLFNETSEVYTPTDDMLRVSDGKWNKQNFIRCTQTTSQAVNDSILLVGQTITQAGNPVDDNVSEATAIVENITKFQQGSIEIIEVEINPDTTVGTFVTGQVISGVSNADEDTIVKMTTSSALSTATITNDGSTLSVGDEATVSGGAGAGARIQVGDISGGGIDEVVINAAGTGYQEDDIITFASGTAEAKIAIVGGGFAPETGSVDVHVELESGTITGGGSGDLLLETFGDGTQGKFLDSSSTMVDREVKIELENEVGHMLSEEDGGTNTSDRHYIVHQEHELDIPYNMEETDHIVQEEKTQDDTEYPGDKLVQENETGDGDITDVRMIAGGSGYTTLPTATITIGDRFLRLEDQTKRQRLGAIALETSGEGLLELEQSTGNILDEQDSLQAVVDFETIGAGRIEFEDGGRVLSETFTGADATIVPFGSEIGRATSLLISEHGINYTSAPTLSFPHYAVLKTVSGNITEDETFTSSVSGATGTVVDFSSPLLKYTATTSALVIDDTVTFSGGTTAIVAKSDPLTGTATIGVNISTDGKYVNQDGFISESSKKIQDSLYYQDYSYVVKVSESINKWRDALKRAIHPSGFYVTGEVNIATRLSAQIRQPVGATLASGLFTGTSDSPIYMRLNSLFNTIFGRRTGAALSSSFGGTQLDGLTKRTRAAASAGYPVAVADAFTSSHYNAREVDVNATPETTIELQERNRNSFYDLNSYTVRGHEVRNGYAYGGPRVKNLSDRAFSIFAANNAITLEGGAGDGEVLLENESGVLQHPQSDSWSTTIADWNTLRFGDSIDNGRIMLELASTPDNDGGKLKSEGETGIELEDNTGHIIQQDGYTILTEDSSSVVDGFSLNSNVDGETMRLSDINGTNSSQNHRINFAFPTEVTKSA